MNFYQIFLVILLYVISAFIFLIAIRSFFFLVVVIYLNLKRFHRDYPFLRIILNTIRNYFKKAAKKKYDNLRVKEYLKENYNEKNNCTFIHTTTSSLPFISILIASFNENFVIDRLLSSIYNLEYDNNNYEIIIVDDSNDNTSKLLKQWEKKMINLKIINRQKREGWKGGALNKAIDNINTKSNISLIVDADNILKKNTLLQIATLFFYSQSSIFVIQGYPMSVVFDTQTKILEQKEQKSNDHLISKSIRENWIAKGISFRLCQRNLIEFVAKEKLGLPLPITESLFAAKTEILKSTRFSTDLCEDWDLTLDLYLSDFFNNDNKSYRPKKADFNAEEISNKQIKKKFENYKIITFNQNFVSFTEATKKLRAYFRQRKRVSEGHTRGFKKKIMKIMRDSKLPLSYKIELILMGLRYSKYILVVSLVIFDVVLLFENGFMDILNDYHLKILFELQYFSLLLYLLYNAISIKICFNYKRQFNAKDALYLLLLNLCTIPAFFIGSIFGLVRKNGVFYRTDRNN